MKKILFLIAVLSAMLFTTTAFAIQGEGTEESPFLITNQEELMLVSDFPDCHFKLMNDIVLEGYIEPLCKYSSDFTGVFDGNGKTISNLTINESSRNAGLFCANNGIIKNLNVITSEIGVLYDCDSSSTSDEAGILVGYNQGEISDCKITGNIRSSCYGYAGGVVGQNAGTVKRVFFEGSVSSCYGSAGGIVGKGGTVQYAFANATISATYSSAGGIMGAASSEENISDSYFIGTLKSNSDYTGGIVGNFGSLVESNVRIKNCFAVATHSAQYDDYKKGIIHVSRTYRSPSVTKSFYDTTVSGLSDTGYGTPKTTMAMKMKKTYTDAGWDFENVWGIDENINDGYPYLLWEYAENGSADAEIIGVTVTNNSLKFISEVATEGETEIATFGTTFIPLWLFETGSADVATVEYNNAEHNIQNNQTFGATLGGIPESCKGMAIVGKSFIKNANGIYTWSAAKSASVNDATLNEVE